MPKCLEMQVVLACALRLNLEHKTMYCPWRITMVSGGLAGSCPARRADGKPFLHRQQPETSPSALASAQGSGAHFHISGSRLKPRPAARRKTPPLGVGQCSLPPFAWPGAAGAIQETINSDQHSEA